MSGHKTRFSLFFFFLLSAIKADFFNREQCICVLFTDPQISLLINFFIKNGSTILFTYLKIILLQCFSVFNFGFQFSAVSKRILKSKSRLKITFLHCEIWSFYFNVIISTMYISIYFNVNLLISILRLWFVLLLFIDLFGMNLYSLLSYGYSSTPFFWGGGGDFGDRCDKIST